MSAPVRYDSIIIGAGQAGGPLAGAFARAGRRVALIEREHVGGTCINEGCTPTKTMVASARVAWLARRAAEYGVQTGPVSVDLARVRERKQSIVDSFRNGSRKRLEQAEGLDLLDGEARFLDARTVAVELTSGGERRLTADTIVINTGGRPAPPPLEGLETVAWLDSTSIMELTEVPPHLIVIGGGYIGLEFAQMFRRFGSEVTVLQRNEQLLPQEDPDIADAIRGILEEDGLRIRLGVIPVAVAPDGAGVRVTLADGGAVSGTHLLVATGRVPNTDRLQLDAAGVATDQRGQIRTDERLATSVPGIWAAGDVKGGPAFTHVSYDDYRILRANLLEGGSATVTDRLVPYCVYIDPQLGRVGLSEREARRQGVVYHLARLPMTHVARALEANESRGFMKALVDPGNGRILGAAVLGLEGGEVMTLLQVAMMGQLPYTALRDATFAHPALAESLNNLFATVSAP